MSISLPPSLPLSSLINDKERLFLAECFTVGIHQTRYCIEYVSSQLNFASLVDEGPYSSIDTSHAKYDGYQYYGDIDIHRMHHLGILVI